MARAYRLARLKLARPRPSYRRAMASISGGRMPQLFMNALR